MEVMDTDTGGKPILLEKKRERKPERKLSKLKKPSLFSSGHFYKIRIPNHKRTTGHGQYKSFTLQVVENTGAGACLFLSILQHLQHEKYGSIDPGGPRTAMDIRLDVVGFLIDNWFDYVQGFVNYDEKFNKVLEKYNCLEWQNMEKCQKRYREYMSKATTWGTTVELTAAAKLYDFKCVVLQVADDKKTLTISIMNNEDMRKRDARRTCFILFSGDPDYGHFRFLKPLGDVLPVTSSTYELKTVGNVSTATFVKGKPHTTTFARYEFEESEE